MRSMSKRNGIVVMSVVAALLLGVSMLALVSTSDPVSASEQLFLQEGFDGEEGTTVRMEWEDGKFDDYTYFALVVAGDKDDESTWTYEYMDSALFVGSPFLAVNSQIVTGSAFLAVVPIDNDGPVVDGIVFSERVYKTSEGLSAVVPVTETAASSLVSAKLYTNGNAVLCGLDDEFYSSPCAANPWAGAIGNDISSFVGWWRGLELGNNSLSWGGAYTKASPHALSTGNTGFVRNPYGFAYCVQESVSGGGNAINPALLPDGATWNSTMASLSGGLYSNTVRRQVAANWIMTHFGNMDVWAVDSAWSLAAYDEASPGSVPNVYTADGLTYTFELPAGVPHTFNANMIDRQAAVHIAMRKLLVPNYTYAVSTLEELNVVVLAQQMMRLADEYSKEVTTINMSVAVTSIPKQAVVTVTDQNNNPLPGVLVSVKAGATGIVFTGLENTNVAGNSGADDSFNHNINLIGGEYTNSLGKATLSYSSVATNAAAEFVAEYPKADASLWEGGTGSQGNVAMEGVITSAALWSQSTASSAYLRIVKYDTSGNTLPGASFTITKYGTSDVVRFAYRAVAGVDPDSGGSAYWVGQIDSGSKTVGDLVSTLLGAGAGGTSSMSNSAYVSHVYQNVLLRSPTPTELGNWTTWLNSNSRTAFTVFVLESVEFTNIVAPSNYSFGTTISTATTNSAGIITQVIDVGGIYSAYENSPPAGYSLYGTRRKGAVGEIGVIKTLTFVNAPLAKFFVHTRDAYTGNPITNVDVAAGGSTVTTNGSGDAELPSSAFSSSGGSLTLVADDSSGYQMHYSPAGTKTVTYASGAETHVTFYYYPEASLTTSASPQNVRGDGSNPVTLTDQITVTNLAQVSSVSGYGQSIDLTVELYGPFSLEGDIAKAANKLVATQSIPGVQAGVGDTVTVSSQGFSVMDSGYYAFYVSGVVEDVLVDQVASNGSALTADQSGVVDHAFGIDEETVRVINTGDVIISTQVSLDGNGDAFVTFRDGTPGVSHDVITFDELLPSEQARVTVTLHGPFSDEEDIGNAVVVPSETATVFTLNGTTAAPDVYGVAEGVPEFDVDEEGWYAYEVSIQVDDNDDGLFSTSFAHTDWRNDLSERFFVQKEVTVRALKLGEIVSETENYAPLSGAAINLYRVVVDENDIETNEFVGGLISDVNGYLEFDVIAGFKYCFIESTPPSGYILNDEPYCTNGIVEEDVLLTSAVVIPNDKDDIPPSGFASDSARSAGLLALLLGGVFVSAGIGVSRKHEETF